LFVVEDKAIELRPIFASEVAICSLAPLFRGERVGVRGCLRE
jgi:hypothetical protein